MSAAARDEALAEAARLAREQAPTLCRKDPATGESCAWHHGLWPTLRLLGLVTEPELHGEFLRHALGGIGGESPRILLSGASDHALLQLVLGAFGARRPRITAIDICDTPLMLDRWHAARVGAAIDTQRSDILGYENADVFDAVCTHAFLSHFDATRRVALLKRWRALLRPGGKVITVNRLRPGREANWIAFSLEQVWAYRARVEDAARERSLEVAGLAKAAEVYARRQVVFPMGSAGELGALFEQAGFAVEHLSVASLAPAAQQKVNAPAVPSTDDYAQLIAVRR